jgi:rhodanese-related sulfurtransferase
MRRPLALAAAVLLALVAAACSEGSGELGAVLREVKAGRAVLVDVRSPGEWSAGHLAEARLIPTTAIASGKADLSALPKDRPVYLHCSVGGRARFAASVLRQKGFDARPLDASPRQLVEAGFRPAR